MDPNGTATDIIDDEFNWYVLRDLRRSNAKVLGYQQLRDDGFKVFTPMKWVIEEKRGQKKRLQKPVLSDLLFVFAQRHVLDNALADISTLQYRYVRGGYCRPMIVPQREMDNFIKAVSLTDDPVYYLPDEITDLSVGRSVRIVSGPGMGMEGRIIKVRGARKKRVLVELPSIMAASVEIKGEFLEFID